MLLYLPDAGTQVHIVPEKKNLHVQTQVRSRTTGIIIVCQFSLFCYHNNYGHFLVGSQVSPRVCSIGIQCCIGDGESLQKSTNRGVQCSFPSSASTFQGISEESESEMSQCSYDQPSDVDTSGYTLEDESSS